MNKVIDASRSKLAQNRYRVLAFLIDFFIFCLIGVVIGQFYGDQPEGEIGFELNGLPALILFGFGFLLWPISEGLFGKTIGKRIFRLKVVSENYQDINIGHAFVRFFLGFVDYMLLIGLIIASNNKKKQRIGDLVAKTIVIKEA